MHNLQASVQVINMLKEENESLHAEKEAAEELLEEVKQEVGKGMKQQEKFNAKVQREKFQSEKKAVEERMKAQSALLAEVNNGLEEARENARLRVEQDKLKAEKEAADATVKECRILLESVQFQVNDGMMAAKSQSKAERKKNLELIDQLSRLEAEKVEAEEKAAQCQGLLTEVYEGLKASTASGDQKVMLEKLEREREQLRVEKESLEAKAALETAQLKRDKDEAQKQVNECTSLLQSVRKELGQRANDAKNQSMEEKKKNEKLQQQLNSLAAEKEIAQTKVVQCEGLLFDVYHGLEHARAGVEATSQEKERLEKEQERLRKERAEMERKAALEAARLKQEKETTQMEASVEAAKLLEEQDRLRAQKRAAQAKAFECERQLEIIRTEVSEGLTTLKSERKATKKQNSSLKKQVAKLTKEKEAADSKARKCERKLAEVLKQEIKDTLDDGASIISRSSNHEADMMKELQLLRIEKEAAEKRARKCEILLDEVFHNNDQKRRIQMIEASRHRSFPVARRPQIDMRRSSSFTRDVEDEILVNRMRGDKTQSSRGNTVARAIESHRTGQLERKASKIEDVKKNEKKQKKEKRASAKRRSSARQELERRESSDTGSYFGGMSLPSVENMVPSLDTLFKYV